MATPPTKLAPLTATAANGAVRPDPTLDLRSLAVEVFGAIGALVEERAGGLDVLVPEAYQRRLDGSGFLRLTSDPEVAARSEAQLLAIGSPIADQIVGVSEELGLTSRWYVDGLRWSRRQAINLNRWPVKFTNARFTGDGVETAFASQYLLMNFQVSYLTDEKHDELRTVVVDVGSRQPAPLLQRLWRELLRPVDGTVYVPDTLRPAGATWPEPIALAPRPEHPTAGADRLPDATALESLHRRALVVLEREIAGSIASYRRRANRQLELERIRIDAFYDDSEAELRRRLQRADVDGHRQTIQSKIEANQLERAHKLADIQAQHRLRLTVKLLNAAFITQPKVRTHLKVENRYASAELAVIYDPLTGEIELPTCRSCDEATASVHLCANGHLVCDGCALPCAFCKREHCRDCGVGTCAVCGRSICAQHQTRCPDCGAVTCPEDRGRCHRTSGE